MDDNALYELMVEAAKQALREELGGPPGSIVRRMVGGRVIFEDNEGRRFKDVEVSVFFRKVTAVREKLRVLEQKINNVDGLAGDERAEIQGLITRAYGSLTTFNFLFADEGDKFKGSGGE